MGLIGIKDKILDFKDIEEIKFTRVGENTFSLSIKSDIGMDNKILKDSMFESQLCTLDPTIELYMQNRYTIAWIGENHINSKCLTIPVNINLLLDVEKQKLFTITTNSDETVND